MNPVTLQICIIQFMHNVRVDLETSLLTLEVVVRKQNPKLEVHTAYHFNRISHSSSADEISSVVIT